MTTRKFENIMIVKKCDLIDSRRAMSLENSKTNTPKFQENNKHCKMD